jgi:hypothetical protein
MCLYLEIKPSTIEIKDITTTFFLFYIYSIVCTGVTSFENYSKSDYREITRFGIFTQENDDAPCILPITIIYCVTMA